ncbi:MAG: membrane integrity-associated transporter subunit PqiC [Proteobacteria bacterium]|nr:membrane integrity-associated transporter subunit PqiC [Pseudomonadota bacterium]
MKLLSVAFAGALLAACASSPPMHYYTLTEMPASSRLTVPENTIPVRLDRVTIPTELDRSQIVRRVGPTQLQIVENDRWAAPLDETIRRVLSNDLAARLPPGAVANPNEPAIGEKRQSLAVDISEFYGDPSCTVTLRASWTLKQSDSRSLHGDEEAKATAQDGCNGSGTIPGAMSQALGQLSEQIAAAVSKAGAHEAQ